MRACVHRLSPSQCRCHPDEEGSDDEWLAKAEKGIRVRFQHDVLVCVVAQGDLKNIWSTSGAKRAHVEMLLTFQNTRGQFGTVLIRRSYLTNGRRCTITDCKSLFDCLAKDASVPEDRRTAFTVESRSGKRPETFRTPQ